MYYLCLNVYWTVLLSPGVNPIAANKYSRTLIYRFSRGWRKQTMNAGKQLIRETTFVNKKIRTLSFASWQNFASIENMTFQDLRCFHGPHRLHFAHRKTL